MGLQTIYNDLSDEIENLGKKLTAAKLLSQKIQKLKQSENFIPHLDMVQLKGEIEKQTQQIKVSIELLGEIQKLKGQIQQIKSSADFHETEKIKQIFEEIETKQKVLDNATLVINEISLLQNNDDFYDDSEIEDCQNVLDGCQLPLHELQSLLTQDLSTSPQAGKNAVLQVVFSSVN